MKSLLIVNPQSGGGTTREVFQQQKERLERELGAFDVAWTERSNHATEIAEREAKAGRGTIIGVGGDGTFNEIVAGVMRLDASARPVLGVLPCGTGGDLLRHLGMREFDEALKRIVTSHAQSIDVGHLSYTDRSGNRLERSFVNILSVGIGGLVDEYVATIPRLLGGKAAYALASIRALVDCKRARLKLTVGTHRDAKGNSENLEKKTLDSYMIAICNGSYFGSGMHVAPMAKVDDGLFEIVSIGGEGKFDYALATQGIYSGAHLSNKNTTHFSCTSIEIEVQSPEANDRFLIDCDGEPIGRAPLKATVVPRAIRLLS